MKHSFIDKYSTLGSPVHRLDARLRLVAAFMAILVMVSVPKGVLAPFVLFSLLIFILTWLSRVPFRFIFGRCLIVAPFILISAAFYPISSLLEAGATKAPNLHEQIMTALSIVIKAFLSVVMVTLLVSTGKFHELLHGLRRMKAPKLLGVLSAMMYRYVFILYDEALRTSRARESRTPGKCRTGRIKTFGNRAMMVFIRSWSRSQTVYHAMLSRGFTGEFPVRESRPVPLTDIVATGCFILAFLAIRIAFHNHN